MSTVLRPLPAGIGVPFTLLLLIRLCPLQVKYKQDAAISALTQGVQGFMPAFPGDFPRRQQRKGNPLKYPQTFHFEQFVVEGFQHVFLRALVDSFAGGLNIGGIRHDEHRNAGMQALHGAERRQPVRHRLMEIEQYPVDRKNAAIGGHCRRLLSGFGFQDFEAPLTEPVADPCAGTVICIHDKNTPTTARCKIHTSCRA